MKKLFILLTVLSLGVCAFSYEYDNNSNPFRQMQKSYEEQNGVCFDIAHNFHYDSNFSAYVKNLCHQYTSERERTLSMLFPSNNKKYSDGTSSREQMAKFAIAKDNEQIKYYKQVAEQYCKYNSNRLTKKDPKACERFYDMFD